MNPNKFKLLTRDQFREKVFARDGFKCVVCKAEAVDAHHLLERSLWPESQAGGYFLENGASVCTPCHLAAESTELSCDELRKLAKITEFPLPEHFSPNEQYDKWGNLILPNGSRWPGELFHKDSVQEIIKPFLHLFTYRIKYPRTYHLPWSPGATNDDKILSSLKGLENEEVVVTAKMDGENTTLYRDYLHARSTDYEPHPSRTWLKSYHSQFAHEIPENWRICGENLFAQHSIIYQNLSNFFQVFSIWNDRNVCLSWDETVEWIELLGLQSVPVLYRGPWDERLLLDLKLESLDNDPLEGYVVRVARSLSYREFRSCVGKMVRANHVQTDQHWMNSKVTPNQLK